MGLAKLVLNIMDPFKLIRTYILKPTMTMGIFAYEHYKNKTQESVESTKNIVIRFGIIAFAVILIIWSSIFMYVCFYYTYMPAIAHTRPVNMVLSQSCRTCGTYPTAHVSLTKKQQILMVGQPYKVFINIDMPESKVNHEVGMFTICAEMKDQDMQTRESSCRLTMMHYKSPLLKSISTFFLSPLLIFGYREEKQELPIELFSNFEDDQTHPVTSVVIEIRSDKLQFYSVTLHITAHFTGLRYLMFHRPILSAIIGISICLFFIILVCILSWYHWNDNEWYEEAKEKYKKIMRKTQNKMTPEKIENLSAYPPAPPAPQPAPQTPPLNMRKEMDMSLIDDENISILDDEEIESLGKSEDDSYSFAGSEEGLRQRTISKSVSASDLSSKQ